MPVILFDGVCNFCNQTVNIILEHDQDQPKNVDLN